MTTCPKCGYVRKASETALDGQCPACGTAYLALMDPKDVWNKDRALIAAEQPSGAAAVALVAANLLPLALVLAGQGDVGGLVVLYWAENVVTGFYTVLRMLAARGGSAGERVGKTIFFSIHYGMFCFVHGVFVTTLFLSPEQLQEIRALPPWPGFGFFAQQLWLGAGMIGLFSIGALLLPLLALAASHGVSFYVHYIRNGRYLTARPEDSFWRPYPRMVLLHLCIIGGAFFIMRHGSSVPMLVALVIGKTLIDLTLHTGAPTGRAERYTSSPQLEPVQSWLRPAFLFLEPP